MFRERGSNFPPTIEPPSRSTDFQSEHSWACEFSFDAVSVE